MERNQMSDAARELLLWMENNEPTYKHLQAIERAMVRHIVAGRYDLDLAVKGFRHAVNGAAKEYARINCGPFTRVVDVFPMSDRDVVAEWFALAFIDDVRGYLRNGSEDIGEAARVALDKAMAKGWVAPEWLTGKR